ncbi:jg3083, partial [Pararge aegeria aegeria]
TGSNYYHCGVCNNLQTISDIDEHIRFKHKTKIIHALEIFRESRNDCTNDNTNAITEKEITDAQKGTTPPANFNVLLNENVRIDQVNEDQTERQTTINESNDNVTHISTINATNDIKIGNENKGDQFITEANTNKDLKTDINDNNDDQINIESNTSNNTKTDINENKGEETKIETNAINDVKTDINESNDDEMNMKTNTINDMKSDIIVSNDDKISFKTNTKHDMKTDINKSNVNQTNIETNTGNDIKTDVNESNENQINKETNTNNNMKIDINKNNALAISNENECNDKEYEINNENPSIFNDILINKFGTTLRVSFISYNLVSRRQNVYHCSMCDKTACDTDMTCHIKEPCHVVKLRQLPFQEKSCVNLIRTVGLQNHCTICNIIFKSNQTESHIIESNHVKCLSVALAINKPTMHPVALGVYPLPIPRPMIRPIIINNQKQIPHPTVLTNVRPMIPPTLAINQWPTLPPPRGTKPLFDSPIKDLNRNAKQPTTAPKNYKNPSETFMNQAPVRQPKNRTNSIIKLDTEQREIDSNKRNASLPILKIVEPKNHTNQGATGLALNENNQHTVTKLKIDTKKPKTDKNQRATDSSKKDDGKIESVVDMLDVDESLSDADDDYDFFNEKFVYLKFKNTFIQVSLVSYNSLVNTGDGTRYCFVCMLRICGSLKKHVESKNHEKCMDECKFVNKYDRHLLRQMFLNYHCSVCNIIITRKYVNQHIAWPLHEPDTKTDKKTRRTHIKAGGKIQNITFQNEAIYPNENETDIKVLVKIEIKANSQNVEQIQKKNKIILFGQKVLKISWDSYHGFSKHRLIELLDNFIARLTRRMFDRADTSSFPHIRDIAPWHHRTGKHARGTCYRTQPPMNRRC